MEWAPTYAEALAAAAGRDVTLSPDEEDAVLVLARLVAHGSERRNAPLAAFLAGKFVGHRLGQGVPVNQALSEASAIAEHLLGPGADTRPAT
jgi:uncharacterized protein YcfJ